MKTVTGKLWYSPEMRYTPSGKAVCVFTIQPKDDDNTSAFDCEAWEELAERIVDRELKPQQKIEITGYFRKKKWAGRDGQEHEKRVFIVKSGRPIK